MTLSAPEPGSGTAVPLGDPAALVTALRGGFEPSPARNLAMIASRRRRFSSSFFSRSSSSSGCSSGSGSSTLTFFGDGCRSFGRSRSGSRLRSWSRRSRLRSRSCTRSRLRSVGRGDPRASGNLLGEGLSLSLSLRGLGRRGLARMGLALRRGLVILMSAESTTKLQADSTHSPSSASSRCGRR